MERRCFSSAPPGRSLWLICSGGLRHRLISIVPPALAVQNYKMTLNDKHQRS